MSLLESIREPTDLRRLSRTELDGLAREIRDFLVTEVTRTGGHLGPNLGVVELTLALHRVFGSPRDRIVWDTGHQAYVHKIVTGRAAGFAQLRQAGGLSGYPSRAESEHDVLESSHASAALSWADGIAKAYQLTGEDRAVVGLGDPVGPAQRRGRVRALEDVVLESSHASAALSWADGIAKAYQLTGEDRAVVAVV